jgi:X-X-X-Leu-X-X-Gly heptad repeat protein
MDRQDHQDHPHSQQDDGVAQTISPASPHIGADGHSGNGRTLPTSAAVIESLDQDAAGPQADVSKTADAVCPRCGSLVDEYEYCATCGMHLVTRPSRTGGRIRAREIVLPLIALIALAGLGSGIYAIATQPQTATLRHDVTSLKAALSSAQQQILALQTSVAHAASQGNVTQLQSTVGSLQHGASLLRGNVGQLQGGIGQLQASVGQLQGSVAQLQSQTSRLLTCLPQLQQQVDSLNVKTTNVGGWLTSATLSNPTAVSKGCAQTVFGF